MLVAAYTDRALPLAIVESSVAVVALLRGLNLQRGNHMSVGYLRLLQLRTRNRKTQDLLD